MEREEVYDGLYHEIALYAGSVESAFIEENKLDLLQKMSALTDAVAFERMSYSEAKAILRDHIQTLRAKRNEPAPDQKPETGVISF